MPIQALGNRHGKRSPQLLISMKHFINSTLYLFYFFKRTADCKRNVIHYPHIAAWQGFGLRENKSLVNDLEPEHCSSDSESFTHILSHCPATDFLFQPADWAETAKSRI